MLATIDVWTVDDVVAHFGHASPIASRHCCNGARALIADSDSILLWSFDCHAAADEETKDPAQQRAEE
jgi:hypothetical protein